MTNSILIGSVIYSLLTGNEEVTEKVGTKVFPIVAENDTTFPFITYTRTSIAVKTISKDGYVEDSVTFQVIVASDSYIESVNIANKVRKALEHNRVEAIDLDMVVSDIKLTSISEIYNDNTYVQTMNFSCTTI